MTKNKTVSTRLSTEDYLLLQKFCEEHNIKNYDILKFLLRNYYNIKYEKTNYQKTPVILKDTHNGKILEFESISKLMENKICFHISRTTIYRRLNKKSTKLIKKRYEIQYK